MPEIERDSGRIYYESHGEGDPLILIRGLGSNADHWYAQVPEFARHYRVITFDNRGIARSSDSGAPFTIADMAADTIALMDGLGLERTHLLGLSMGGMVAQEMAIRYPQRVRGLILAVTHCGGSHVVSPDREVTEAIQRVAVENSDAARLAALPAFFSPRTLKEQPQVAQEYGAVSLKHPAGPDILRRQIAAISAHDTCERLDRIESPTLVLTAAGDVLVPPENSTVLAERIPNAQLYVSPEGGHQVLIEAVQDCNRVILEFLQKVDADPGFA